VPIPFALYYATEGIDPRHTYQVRADIVIDGQRRFLTAQAYPVLTRGNPNHLEMVLQQTPEKAPATVQDLSQGWRVEDMPLPSTFSGRLARSSGGPLSITLNLYADRMFFIRKQTTSKPGKATSYDHGRWYLSHDGRRLVLAGEAEGIYKLAVKDDDTLHLSSLNGRKDLLQDPVTLQRSATLDPFAEGVPLAGLFRYMADAALFTECFTGTSFPVAQEGDYLALERAYLAARGQPGGPMYVTLTGHVGERPPMEGNRPETMLVVDRFETISHRTDCLDRLTQTNLTNTTWKLTELYGQTIHFISGGKGEPHLIMRPPEDQLIGFSGCNGFFGLYRKEGDRLTFSDLGATMMACPNNADLERTYFKAIKATERYKIFGQQLELYHGGEVVARFEAAH
jgi:heat shock protein HslJ